MDQTGGPVPCGNRHQQPIVCSLEWDYPVFWIFCFKLKVPKVFFNIFLLNCFNICRKALESIQSDSDSSDSDSDHE